MIGFIRPYTPADRDAIRQICCETGFSGKPVDPLFSDREVFADFFTRYYTDWEPESTLVVEDQGKVVGYLNGCIRYRYHLMIQFWLLIWILFPKILRKLLLGRYDAKDRAFLFWCVWKGNRETPAHPPAAAHFHFNLLPEYRNSGVGIRLLNRFLDLLPSRGVKFVYGQIQTGPDRRPDRVFERFGFTCLDRKEITKFQGLHNKTVYVSTFVKKIS